MFGLVGSCMKKVNYLNHLSACVASNHSLQISGSCALTKLKMCLFSRNHRLPPLSLLSESIHSFLSSTPAFVPKFLCYFIHRATPAVGFGYKVKESTWRISNTVRIKEPYLVPPNGGSCNGHCCRLSSCRFLHPFVVFNAKFKHKNHAEDTLRFHNYPRGQPLLSVLIHFNRGF